MSGPPSLKTLQCLMYNQPSRPSLNELPYLTAFFALFRMYLCSSGVKTLERQIGDPNLSVFEAQGEFLNILCFFH
jgi:hypothetical protein